MRHVLAVILSMWIATQAVRAEGDHEPTVYFFWAGSCPHCAIAQTFLDKVRDEDPRIRIRDFEVENSLANAIVFSRVYERIGMAGLGAVPLILVGPHVFVGFDEESGREIFQYIKDCRKTACRDIVHDLIRQPSDLDQTAVYFVLPPLCTTKLAVASESK
jgi:hypothetical protein